MDIEVNQILFQTDAATELEIISWCFIDTFPCTNPPWLAFNSRNDVFPFSKLITSGLRRSFKITEHKSPVKLDLGLYLFMAPNANSAPRICYIYQGIHRCIVAAVEL